MKAVICDGFGGIDVLKIVDTDVPKPEDNQVLIKVAATTINRPDLVQREGKYPPPPGESDILGLEVSGIIEEVGSKVTRWKKGQKVMALVAGGGYAEYAIAYDSHIVAMPDSMSFEEAACASESYITAFLNVFLLGKLENGQTAVFHGGGGGVNTAAIQITKALTKDVKLIVTAHPKKIEGVKKLGVDLIVDYTETPDFSSIVKEFTNKKGVNLILDHIGAKYLEPNIKSLAYAGRLVIIGVTSGIKAELNLGLVMVKRHTIIGSVLRSRPIEEKAEIIQAFTEKVVPKFADRTIVPIIDAVIPMSDVKRAHQLMEEDNHFGKIVLKIADL